MGANFFIFENFQILTSDSKWTGSIYGGRNCQKSPKSNWGPGGRWAPPGLVAKGRGVGGQFQLKLSAAQSTIDCRKEKLAHPNVWKPTTKNQNFPPKSTKTQKNTKIVKMTSYSQCELSKKLASQKYKVLIFGTNEGDFSGTPVKNQLSTKHCYEFSKFTNFNVALPRGERVLPAGRIRSEFGQKMDLL